MIRITQALIALAWLVATVGVGSTLGGRTAMSASQLVPRTLPVAIASLPVGKVRS